MRPHPDCRSPAKRRVDNAGFSPAGTDPRAVPDAALYEALMSEFPAWLDVARAEGILA